MNKTNDLSAARVVLDLFVGTYVVLRLRDLDKSLFTLMADFKGTQQAAYRSNESKYSKLKKL